MPSFSQARKYIITELMKNELIKTTTTDTDVIIEPLTTKIAFKISKLYYFENVTDLVSYFDSTISCTSDAVITCICEFSSLLFLKKAVKDIIKKPKNNYIDNIKLIYQICSYIKKNNKNAVAAIFPLLNRSVYLNSDGYIRKDLFPMDAMYNKVCILVYNNEDGKNFIANLESKNKKSYLTE